MTPPNDKASDFIFPEANEITNNSSKDHPRWINEVDGVPPDMDSVSRRTTLKGLLGGTAVASLGTSVTAAETTNSDDFDRINRIEIESFDGTTIVGSLYEPTNTGPHPAMLITHGWGADRGAAYVRRLAEMYAKNDYVVLTYDSRGFGESGGEVGVNGPKEVEDAQTLISWLADRGNVRTKKKDPDNPSIGMDSLSYAGGIQLNTAAVDDRLDAIVPRWAWHDLVYSLAPDDVIKSGWGALLYAVGITGSRGVSSGDGSPEEHDVRYGLTEELHEVQLKGAAFNEFPDDIESFYKVRSPTTKLDEIDTPALFVHGWPDTLFVPNEAIWNYHGLRERGVETRLLLFEGGHTFSDTADSDQRAVIDDAALDWIETHVRGKGGKADLAPVTYYEVQTGEFHEADDIPPTSAGSRTLNLADAASGDSTVVVNSVAPTSTSQILPENEDLTSATAVNFDYPLTDGLEVFGPPQLQLQVEPLGPEARLFTKFYHVHDGRATLINNQVTPLKVEGSLGIVETTDVEMVAFQRRFAAGDTLRFTIATTDAAFYPSRESAGARIHHSDTYASTIDLPVVNSGDSLL